MLIYVAYIVYFYYEVLKICRFNSSQQLYYVQLQLLGVIVMYKGGGG